MNASKPATGRASVPRFYNVRLHHNRHLIVAIHVGCVTKVGKHRRHWEITDIIGRRWLTDYDTTTYREPLTTDPYTRGDAVMLVESDGSLHLALT